MTKNPYKRKFKTGHAWLTRKQTWRNFNSGFEALSLLYFTKAMYIEAVMQTHIGMKVNTTTVPTRVVSASSALSALASDRPKQFSFLQNASRRPKKWNNAVQTTKKAVINRLEFKVWL